MNSNNTGNSKIENIITLLGVERFNEIRELISEAIEILYGEIALKECGNSPDEVSDHIIAVVQDIIEEHHRWFLADMLND